MIAAEILERIIWPAVFKLALSPNFIPWNILIYISSMRQKSVQIYPTIFMSWL